MTMALPHPTSDPEHVRWRAVVARDGTWDGRFVYAVRSTGIYCRPSCPARRPARSRVAFYDAPLEAEQAGFRACRRCRPEQPETPEVKLVQQVLRLLESSPGRAPSLTSLSRAVGRSPHYVQRMFKRVVGVSPWQWAAARRVGTLKQRLRAGDSVSRAQFEAGFGSSSRLYEKSDGALGMTPATYRRGGVGLRIGYVIVATDLGSLLVAGTERGLCAVRFGPSKLMLTRSLAEEFPEAELVPNEPRASVWAASLRAQAEGIKPSALLPLDVRATAFQVRVWSELRRIPFGATRTYSEVARAIGHRMAARAVAGACASNPAAMAIPCHRIVRGDGGLGGYRWGLERKRKLLNGEQSAVGSG